jgi:SagB-type dehydrogenase family enzyme
MESIKLPDPDKSTPLSQLLLKRRSVRRYSRGEIDLKELSQILWSTYGLINEERRVVPSAGATYPVEVFIFASRVSGVEPGIYKYSEYEHSLIPLKKGDYSRELAKACLDQSWVKNAPLNIVIVARYRKTTDWYGERGFRYIYMEAGHIGQNIYLSATELGLGTVAVGAFKDEEVARLIGLGEEYIVLYVFPIGRTT